MTQFAGTVGRFGWRGIAFSSMIRRPSASLRIAIAQPTISANIRQNGRTARHLIESAAIGGAHVIQFPEGLMSGYAKEQVQDWDDVDWDTLKEEIHEICVLAARRDLWVILGSAHPLTPPNRPHNSLYIISNRGQVVQRYDKQYCSNTELASFYTPGSQPVVFELGGFRLGCAVCIEVNFPDLFATYERYGVDCMLLSAYPIDSIFATKARAHAAINCYWIAISVPAQAANLVRSQLIGPNGNLLIHVPDGGELLIGEINPMDPQFDIALHKARPWRSSANEGTIYRNRFVEDPRSSNRTCL